MNATEEACARCGMTKDRWKGNGGEGYLVDGKPFCCQACVDGQPCTCRDEGEQLAHSDAG